MAEKNPPARQFAGGFFLSEISSPPLRGRVRVGGKWAMPDNTIWFLGHFPIPPVNSGLGGNRLGIRSLTRQMDIRQKDRQQADQR
jgi:basic membrane lipoprotein Med (substrate-binding protein (PBP1-ABC) superfamily)